jgi:hypothetical protein
LKNVDIDFWHDFGFLRTVLVGDIGLLLGVLIVSQTRRTAYFSASRTMCLRLRAYVTTEQGDDAGKAFSSIAFKGRRNALMSPRRLRVDGDILLTLRGIAS